MRRNGRRGEPLKETGEPTISAPTRIPPHNLDAERAILGVVIYEGAGVLPRIAGKLQVADFYTGAHRVIYSTMLDMGAAGQAIDLITLAEELRRRDRLEAVGGPAFLAQLADPLVASIPAHLDSYLTIVREKAVLRELAEISERIQQHAHDDQVDVQRLLDRSREELDVVASRAVAVESAFQALTLKALLELEIPPPKFLLQDWLPAEALSFVVGDSEAFKSWFVLYLAFCVASGSPLFGRFPVHQAPTLVISEENGLPEDRRRADAITRGMGFDPATTPLHVASDSGFSFDDAAKYAAMRAYVDAHGIRLVVVDSFVRVHRREEKDAGQMNALYLDRIKPLLRAGVAVVALHHKRKLPSGAAHAPVSDSDDIRGSGDIRAAAHAVLFLRPASDTKVVVKHNKARGWKKQEPYVFGIGDSDQGGVVLTYEGKPEDVLDRSQACRVAILEFAQSRGTFYRQDIIDALKGKFSKKVVDPALKELAAKGYPLTVDEHHIGRKRMKFYAYVVDAPEADSTGDVDVPF